MQEARVESPTIAPTPTMAVRREKKKSLRSKPWSRVECEKYFDKEECRKGDPRPRCIDHYHKNGSTPIYLIVVNHHWKLYGGLPFFRTEYFPRFHQLFNQSFDVVYFSPAFRKDLRVVNHTLEEGGAYSYHTLAVGYNVFGHANPYSYAGYFLLNDDAFLDPIYLNEYDLTHSLHEITRVYNPKEYWSWNLLKNEFKVSYPIAFYKAMEDIKLIPDLENRCHLANPQNHRRGLQDFFYVTDKDIDTFVRLSSIFYAHHAFLETAAPTINWCLSHRPINTCNHHFWPNVTTCVHFHPIKLYENSARSLVMNHINRKDIHKRIPMSWFHVCYKHDTNTTPPRGRRRTPSSSPAAVPPRSA